MLVQELLSPVIEIAGSTLCINDPRNLPTISIALNAISPQAEQHPAKQRQLIRKQETNKSLPFVITKGNFFYQADYNVVELAPHLRR
jgi:hypothetical protein